MIRPMYSLIEQLAAHPQGATLQRLAQALVLQGRAADVDPDKLHGSRGDLHGIQTAGEGSDPLGQISSVYLHLP